MSHYNDVLEELKKKKEKLASEYITKMYVILRDEECRPPEECRAKIESDCSDIWSEDTIRRYLPIEVKNTEGLRILANGQGRPLRGLEAYNERRGVDPAAMQKKRDEIECDESEIY